MVRNESYKWQRWKRYPMLEQRATAMKPERKAAIVWRCGTLRSSACICMTRRRQKHSKGLQAGARGHFRGSSGVSEENPRDHWQD